MKRIHYIILVLIIASMLTACGSADQKTESGNLVEPTPNNLNAPAIMVSTNPAEVSQKNTINYEYEGALSNRLLLAFGTLKLAETTYPIKAEQASQMLMLWQALENLSQSGISPEAEVNALLSQIEQIFTSEQISSINAMALTQAELQTWSQSNGITVGSGTGIGSGTGQSTGQGAGQGSGLSPEEKATKQAENSLTGAASAGEGGLSSAITEALISYLEGIK
jgi:hypothetical protein